MVESERVARGKGSKRRWNSERYPKAVTVRVTLSEHQEILSRAERARLSASRYLVRCGLSRRLPPISDRPSPSQKELQELEFLLYELRKVGVNLNQLARRQNTTRLIGGMSPPRTKVDHAAGMVEGLVRLIRRRL